MEKWTAKFALCFGASFFLRAEWVVLARERAPEKKPFVKMGFFTVRARVGFFCVRNGCFRPAVNRVFPRAVAE